MPTRPALNRADLLACLQVYGEAYIEACASVLGYVRRAPAPPVPSPPPPQEEETVPSAPAAARLTSVPRVRFPRIVAQRQLEPAEAQRDEPPWYRDAVPARPDDPILRANPHAPPPPPAPPLMPWARLWPVLKSALSTQMATVVPDMPRLVEALARGQFLRRLPTISRQSWAPTCQVLLDYATPLRPFWSDMTDLQQRLGQMRGWLGFTVLALQDDDPGGPCWLTGPPAWRRLEHYPLPAAGTPVLVLSDLGCLDTSDQRRRQWLHLGRRLQRAGCPVVALLPCPQRWWDGELLRLFISICWDRAVQPPRHLVPLRRAAAPLQPPAHDAGAEQLLRMLGVAIRVEPALLRAVRYLLPARQVDVGSEAAAWNHPQVRATPLAFAYQPDAMHTYREAFAAQPQPLRQQVAALMAVHHAALSPMIGEEEQWLLPRLTGRRPRP